MFNFLKSGPDFRQAVTEFMVSSNFHRLADATKEKHRLLFPRLVIRFGDLRLSKMTHAAIAAYIGELAGTPGLANNMLDRIRMIMRLAVERRQISADPTAGIARYPLGTIHTWTDDEMKRFEERWPRGSDEAFTYASPWERVSFVVPGRTARLAFDLYRYSDQRRADVAKMKWSDLYGCRIHVVQQKTGRSLSIPIHSGLEESLALFQRGNGTILVNGHGNKFTPNDLTSMMAAAIRAAGLPKRCVPHGLRKATLRQIAEKGGSGHMLQGISGHADLRELAVYTEAVDQALMADQAIALLEQD